MPKGEPERAAPARARLCRPLRRPTAVGVGVGLARTSSNDSGRSEARQRRSRAGRGRVAHGLRARVGPGHATAAPGQGTRTASVRWHQSGSRGIRVGRPPASAPHPRVGHATVAAPARPDRRAMVRSCRTRVRLRAAAGPPRLSRSRHRRGPVASRSGLQRSRSRRIPVGLVTAAVPAHPRPSPNGCGRRGQQGGLRAGLRAGHASRQAAREAASPSRRPTSVIEESRDGLIIKPPIKISLLQGECASDGSCRSSTFDLFDLF